VAGCRDDLAPPQLPPGLHRYFRGFTWLRAGSGLVAVVVAALVATGPAASFLLASSGIYLAVIGTGDRLRAVFFAVVRRYGLRLRLAPA
jgi:hypothetical protein